MQQQTMNPAALPGEIRQVTPVTSANPLFAGYTIEPELCLPTPRPTIKRSSGSALIIFSISSAVFLFALLAFTAPEYFLVVFVVAVSITLFFVGSNFLLDQTTPRRRILTYGTVQPAILTEVIKQHDTPLYEITYMYTNRWNTDVFESFPLTEQQVTDMGLYRGKLFSLLVNPQKQSEVTPYFLIEDYTILNLPQSGQAAADFGVEPEFYSAVPRPIYRTRGSRMLCILLLNLIVATTAVIVYLAREGTVGIVPALIPFLGYIAPLVFLTILVLLIHEIQMYYGSYFLRSGYAVQATVQENPIREGTQLSIRYTYPYATGKEAETTLKISQQKSDSLGGIEAGSRFTVLLHPKNPFMVVPYFAISGVTLPHATEARFTSPGTSQP